MEAGGDAIDGASKLTRLGIDIDISSRVDGVSLNLPAND